MPLSLFGSVVTRPLIVAVLAAAFSAPLVAQSSDPLFSDEAPSSPQSAADGRSFFVRGRATTLHVAVLARALAAPATNSFTLNLFDDASFPVEIERVEDSGHGHRTWGGHLAGRPLSSVTLTLSGGTVTGLITDGHDVYEINAVGSGSGLHQIDHLDARLMPLDRDVAIPSAETIEPAAMPAIATPAAVSVVDIYVFYTQRLVAQLGIDGVHARAALYIAQANLAYARSGVNGELRLVGLRQIEMPNLPGAQEILTSFRNHPDAVAVRDTVRPDLLALLVVSMPDACGVGYFGPNADASFSATSASSGCVYTFAHEIGHNLGAQHAAEDPVATGPAFPTYARGYKAPNRAFRTLMAYACTGEPQCPRVLNVSNPYVAEGGQATGVVDASDNARRMNELFPIVAAYRQSVPQPPTAPIAPQALVQDHQVTLQWQHPATGPAANYVVSVGSAPQQANLIVVSTGPATSISANAPQGTYYARVHADGAGRSAASSEVVFLIGPPTAPRGLVGSATGHTVSLGWQPPALGGAMHGYVLEAGSLPGFSNIISGALLSPGTSLQVNGVPSGRYFIRLRGRNGFGAGPSTADVMLDVAPTCPLPSPPHTIQATSSGGVTTLQWAAPQLGVAPFVYLLQAGTAFGAANLFSDVVGSGTAVSARIPAGTYYVRLLAGNSCGVSNWSPFVSFAVP